MPSPTNIDWPVAAPFVVARSAEQADIDHFGHVNNVRYIDWAMDAAWDHSAALGLTFDDYRRLGVGCVVQRHEFDYLSPVHTGERALIATWIAANDGRIRLARGFDMRAEADGRRILKGLTRLVSIDLGTGRPARMPAEFVRAYRPAAPR